MISENDFVGYIETLKEADDFMADSAALCNKYGLEYDGGTADLCAKLHSSIVEMLGKEFGDNEQWISWWVYDAHYGDGNTIIKMGGDDEGWSAEYDLNSAKTLYHFLLEYYD